MSENQQGPNTNNTKQCVHFYRLIVNINGFKYENVDVKLVNVSSFCKEESEKDKIQVKVSAKRTITLNNQEATQEFAKSYDIFTNRSGIDVNSMRHYVDPKNPLYLVIEFVNSHDTDESHFMNLDDSCESLVESAAKSLLNVRDIENLKDLIENPHSDKIDPALQNYFSPSILRDLNTATRTTFTPIKIECDQNLNKFVRIELSIPNSIRTASIITDANHSLLNSDNHIKIKFNGLKMNVEALATNENVTSSFSKEFALPRGSQPEKAKFKLDENNHLLVITTPYLDY